MFLSLLCLTLAITGYRKGNVYDMDSFSRNNYVIVGSRTLHCEPPQVYQPTPDPPPPGEETLMSIDILFDMTSFLILEIFYDTNGVIKENQCLK